MAWTTPKTDWDLQYRWDYEDINRIQDNLLYLRDYVANYGTTWFIVPRYYQFDTGKTASSMFYAREMNAIEINLFRLNQATMHIPTTVAPEYERNGPGPDFFEFNRIESLTLAIKEQLEAFIEANSEIIPKLAFTLGSMREVKI